MERVRREVVSELGYTTSAGISHSKILAKVCSAYKKPSAQVSRVLGMNEKGGKPDAYEG